MRHKADSESADDIRTRLRAAGLRCTAARIAVFERLSDATAPMTHAELADELVPRGFDKATVYRNLIDMSDAGILSRAELGDHMWRFEIRTAGHQQDAEHPHFVCVECGSVTCLPDLPMTAGQRKQWAGLGRITEILLKGHCQRCV